MKIVWLLFFSFIFNVSLFSQKYSIGINAGRVRFVDTWVSGFNTDLYGKLNLNRNFFFKTGFGRASGFSTGYSPENKLVVSNKTFFANTNSRIFIDFGVRIINSKHHELNINTEGSLNFFKEYSDFKTIELPNLENGNIIETFRKEAYYDEGKTPGYGFGIEYSYKIRNFGIGLNSSFSRYGDYRMRCQNLVLTYMFNKQ